MSSYCSNGAGQENVVPFHTYLLKVASRCNINCSYCYVYHLADQRWKLQPHFMSADTARQTVRRIREHLQTHDKKSLMLTFHGGEPLLGGIKQLSEIVKVADEELTAYGMDVQFSMQSNLTLLTEEIADFLLEHKIKTGTSLDGPPRWNNVFRIDHQGRGTSEAAERGLAIITAPKYRSIWAGILSVINPFSDPIEVLEYLRLYSPPLIDFLYPLNHYDNLPAGKKDDINSTVYGDWLIQAFDHWWKLGANPDIRIFSSIMRLCCGLSSQVESLGAQVIDLVVVESNGDIEGLDSLKATYDGATCLSANVFETDFNTVARHAMVRFRQSGMDQLCHTCRICPVVKVCGGGYIPHRYSKQAGYDNPSIYCRDLEKLIRHIHLTLAGTLETVTVSEGVV
jgi:uncharacterized protein